MHLLDYSDLVCLNAWHSICVNKSISNVTSKTSCVFIHVVDCVKEGSSGQYTYKWSSQVVCAVPPLVQTSIVVYMLNRTKVLENILGNDMVIELYLVLSQGVSKRS